MADTKINHEKITKPFQLLATWMTGLIAIDSSFLLAAANIETPTWVAGLLTIAAIANVPIFIVSLFLLQTKFRPQMQDDKYFSEYLQSEAIKKEFGSLSLTIDSESIKKIREIKNIRVGK